MKNLRKLVLAIAFIGVVSFANAQSKIAHVNVQQLMSEMPEMKTAQAELQKLGESYQTDIQASYKELQSKMTLYKNEATSKTPDENAKREQELQGMNNSIMQAQQQAQQELQKKEMELLQPILQKANDAIQKVARAQGFQYVLDSSPGSGVIMADGKDLLADVKKSLGF